MKGLFYTFTFLSLTGYGAGEYVKTNGLARTLENLGVPLPTKTKLEKFEIIKEIERPKVKFEGALKRRLENSKMPEFIVRGILKREAREFPKRMGYLKYEESYRKFASSVTANPDEQRAWASSHCPFQIMAWHAHRRGMEWSDLYDPEICVDVGMEILEDCWRKAAKFSKREKVARLGRCYNGGSVDATDSRAVAYGAELQHWAEIAAFDDAIEKESEE